MKAPAKVKLPMLKSIADQADRIIDVLSSQPFYDLYKDGGPFDDYIGGTPTADEKEAMRQQIVKMFKIGQPYT